MKTLNIIALILFSLIILVTIISILFKYHNEKLMTIIKNLESSKNEYDEKLKNKYDLIIKIIKKVETKYKVESKVFEDAKKTEGNINSKNEKIFTKCYSEIHQIIEDNPKVRETKAFKKDLSDYDNNELHILSLRTFHNKYVLIYNNMVKKFPYNIIFKVRKYKLETLIEGKEIDESFNNDLEV